MADVTFKSSDRTEQVTGTGTPAMLVLPEGPDAHRVYFDDQQLGTPEIIRMGAIVIALLRDMGILKDALQQSHANPQSAEFRHGPHVQKTMRPLDGGGR